MSTDDVRSWLTLGSVALGVALSLFAAIHSYRASKAAEHADGGIIEVDGKLFRLDERVDGRLSQLLASKATEAKAAADLARSEGHAEGEQAQRDRSSEPQP